MARYKSGRARSAYLSGDIDLFYGSVVIGAAPYTGLPAPPAPPYKIVVSKYWTNLGANYRIRRRIDITILGVTVTTGNVDEIVSPGAYVGVIDTAVYSATYDVMDVWEISNDRADGASGRDTGLAIKNCVADDSTITVEVAFGSLVLTLSHSGAVSAGDLTKEISAGPIGFVSATGVDDQPLLDTNRVSYVLLTGNLTYSTGEEVLLENPYHETFTVKSSRSPTIGYNVETIYVTCVNGLGIFETNEVVFTPPTPLDAQKASLVELGLSALPPGGYELTGRFEADVAAYPVAVRADVTRTPNAAPNEDPAPTVATVNAAPGFSHSDSRNGYAIRSRVWNVSNLIRSGQRNKNAITNLSVAGNLASLSANPPGERVLAPYAARMAMSLHGKVYPIFTLEQAGSFTVDDGSSLTPSDGSWNGSGDLTLSSGSVIAALVNVGFGGSPVRTLKRAWSSLGVARSFGTYRYLRVRFRLVGKGSSSVSMVVATFGATSGLANGRYREFTLTSGADGAWMEEDIDLCSPEGWGTANSDGTRIALTLPTVDAQQTRYPMPTQDGCMWGAGKCQYLEFGLPSNATDYSIEIDSLTLVRADRTRLSVLDAMNSTESKVSPNKSQGVASVTVHPFLRAVTDGRASLEAWDRSLSAGATSYEDIQGVIDQVNAAVSSGFEYTGFLATAESSFADDYHTLERPAYFVGGAGMIWEGGWIPYLDLAMTSPLVVKAQPRWLTLSFYPGCGDALEHDDGDYGDQIKLYASLILRGASEGLLVDQSLEPARGVVVRNTDLGLLSDTGLNVDAGTGLSDTLGYFLSGLPYGRHAHWVRTKPDGGQSGAESEQEWSVNQRHRSSFRVNVGSRGAYNLNHRLFGYHRVSTRGSDIVYSRSDVQVPGGFDLTNRVVCQGENPRMVYDERGRIALAYDHSSGSVRLAYSDSDGDDWDTGAHVLFDDGSIRDIKTGPKGFTLAIAYLSGNLIGKNRWTGDDVDTGTPWSDEFTLVDENGDPLEIRDEPAAVTQGHEGPARWVLAAGPTGESGVAEWWSGDDGRTWRRVT